MDVSCVTLATSVEQHITSALITLKQQKFDKKQMHNVLVETKSIVEKLIVKLQHSSPNNNNTNDAKTTGNGTGDEQGITYISNVLQDISDNEMTKLIDETTLEHASQNDPSSNVLDSYRVPAKLL